MTEMTGRDQGKRKSPLRGGRVKTRVLCVRIPFAALIHLCVLCPAFVARGALEPVTERDR